MTIKLQGSMPARATLNYVAPADEPLYNYYQVDPPAGRPSSNEVMDPRQVDICSLRDGDFHVDVQGFQRVPFTTTVKDIYDPAERNAVFNPEVEALVKLHTGATECRVVFPFLRGEEAQRRAPGSITAPSAVIHVDYTHESGPTWFDTILGADADRYRSRRFAIINVWRPIVGPLQDRPLAMCDTRTVSPQDLVRSKAYSRVDANGLHSADGHVEEAETYAVTFNPNHRWYYVPEMMPDEALLLKNYDSAVEGVSRFSPHTSFIDPFAPAKPVPRASIEVRVLTIW